MTTYTGILGSEIDTDSPVTESLMTRLRDNPIAITEKASGAPVLANDYVVNAMIATNAVNADSIAASAVNASEIGSNAVINSKIKIASGTSYAGTLAINGHVDLTLHNKSFFPMVHGSAAGVVMDGHLTDAGSGVAPRFGLYNISTSQTRTYDVDYYYIAIS